MQVKHLSEVTIVSLLMIAMVTPMQGGPVQSCTCNNHSFKCKADNEIDSTDDLNGEESLACVNCQHFTMGRNCELCIPFYYRDITKTLDHRDVCLPCLCNTFGSVHGLCDRYNDESRSMIAGQCLCKPNVEGRACDQCKLGFYNFMNADGCEACDCDAEGSYAPYCNPVSGQCPCKPNVTGRRCDTSVASNHSIAGASTDGPVEVATQSASPENTTDADATTGSQAM